MSQVSAAEKALYAEGVPETESDITTTALVTA